jgi:hypothetical protein
MRYLWDLFMKILAGVWYVGVFSDPQPSRFQSKMVRFLICSYQTFFCYLNFFLTYFYM